MTAAVLATLAQADDVAQLPTPSVEWSALVPLLVLGVGALLALTITSVAKGRLGHRFATGWTVAVGLLSALTALPTWARVRGWEDGLAWWDPETTPAGAFSTVGTAVGVDGFSVLVTMLIGVSVAVAALVLDGYLRREAVVGPEAHVLMLLSAAGGVVMASANDLIVLFLGLETLSIAVYVLAAMDLRRYQSQEAGLKYFVLGAFSSAFFLYGIAMVYGGTGTTSLVGIADHLAANLLVGQSAVLVLLGIGLLLVGFGFKVAAVPFHSWSPDAYDGAPSGVVTFMASVVKVAAFAGMVRVLVLAFETFAADWRPVVQVLAVLSLVAGALVGVLQRNVKRLLAYSSISHAGFILLGVDAAGDQGNEAVLIYLVAYSFLVLGSFAVVTVVGRRGDDRHGIDDYRGLAATNPALAGVFTLFLLAQAGVPFTSGFYAKFTAVIAAVDAGSSWLAVVAMLSAVVAAFLYLRVVIAMWFRVPEGDGPDRIPVPGATVAALVVCALVTVWVGILPGQLTDVVDGAEAVLVRPEVEAPPAAEGLPFELEPAPAGG